MAQFDVDIYEYFIHAEGASEALMFSFQSPGIFCAELDAPEPNALIADGDSSLGEQVFNITMTEIESVVQPDCLAGRGAGHPNSPPFRTHRAQFGQ